MAASAGKNLPTRAQWLLAAEGLKQSRFPYGDEFVPQLAAVGLTVREGPLPCGSHPGDRNQAGIYDLSGNTSEWVRDPAMEATAPEEFPEEYDYDTEVFHEACGGNWTSQAPDQSSCRFVRTFTAVDEAQTVGFRCVFDKSAKRRPTTTSSKTPATPKSGFKECWVDKVPPGMVLITPQPGSKAHELVNYAFCIDKYEFPNRADVLPKTGVSWAQANKLAAASGYRLPTRDEWRVACGGAELKEFSTGDECDPTKVNVGRSALESPLPAASGSMNSVSPSGVHDLSGNVLEWVWKKPQGSEHGVMGGCWIMSENQAACSYWSRNIPNENSRVLGFRRVVRLRTAKSTPATVPNR